MTGTERRKDRERKWTIDSQERSRRLTRSRSSELEELILHSIRLEGEKRQEGKSSARKIRQRTGTKGERTERDSSSRVPALGVRRSVELNEIQKRYEKEAGQSRRRI